MPAPKPTDINYRPGVWVACLLIAAWLGMLCVEMPLPIHWLSPFPYLLMLLQTHLYTGLFITAHDGMHGTISRNRWLNNSIATLSAILFAWNWLPRLRRKHYLHHHHPAEAEDPDYHHGNFLAWYIRFVRNYITWYQIVLMAITYNVLKLFFAESNIILFWMLPAILSTLQLFYFGTYLPHRGMHAPDNIHKASSQARNHVWAFLSCYFFGYHYEHHDAPFVPWWLLYKRKDS